jgi:predicted ATPase
MITRLQVRGFKSLLDVDVTLGPLTVFVGANGSGKTSVLEAIRFLRDSVRYHELRNRANASKPLKDSWKLSRILSRQGAERVEVSTSVTSEGSEATILAKLGRNGLQMLVVAGAAQGTTGMQASLPPPWTVKKARGFDFYRLDAEVMARAAYSDETNPRLAFDGGNLAAVLDALQGTAREQFDEIERLMKSFVPMLRRLRVKRARAKAPQSLGNAAVVGHQVAFDFEHAPDISAEDASEGTLLLLGLLTIIESRPPGDMTIMLDDLDRALHPKAQRELVGYLHELVRTRPGLQIIATTHSPYLVEHLAYEEVRAITQAPDGTSVVASLADHPQADRWREEMSAGEFWSSVGESWVLAGRQ